MMGMVHAAATSLVELNLNSGAHGESSARPAAASVEPAFPAALPSKMVVVVASPPGDSRSTKEELPCHHALMLTRRSIGCTVISVINHDHLNIAGSVRSHSPLFLSLAFLYKYIFPSDHLM
jgi:hypothetical protein